MQSRMPHFDVQAVFVAKKILSDPAGARKWMTRQRLAALASLFGNQIVHHDAFGTMYLGPFGANDLVYILETGDFAGKNFDFDADAALTIPPGTHASVDMVCDAEERDLARLGFRFTPKPTTRAEEKQQRNDKKSLTFQHAMFLIGTRDMDICTSAPPALADRAQVEEFERFGFWFAPRVPAAAPAWML
jgi:hypothetical protein